MPLDVAAMAAPHSAIGPPSPAWAGDSNDLADEELLARFDSLYAVASDTCHRALDPVVCAPRIANASLGQPRSCAPAPCRTLSAAATHLT
jgi:hypothetical protein